MKEIQYPFSYEREYQRFVKNIFTEVSLIAQRSIMPFVAGWIASRSDEENPEEESSFATELAALIAALLYIGKLNPLQKQTLLDIAKTTSTYSAKQIQDWMQRQYGFKIPYTENKKKLADWIYIQSITIDGRIQKFTDSVNQSVSNGVMTGAKKADIAQEISKASDTLINGAPFVSGNGIGALMADTSQGMMQESGIQTYQWITQRDERVRPKHVQRHEKIFDWRKPPDDGHPGQPYLCRCVAAPYIKKGQEVVTQLSARNASDLTIYRKGVTANQRPERDKAYAAILKTGRMTNAEVKQLSENPESAPLILQNMILSGRISSDQLKRLRS